MDSMTDIEPLRQDVIETAMAVVSWWKEHGEMTNGVETCMVEAVRSLEEALRPDPWALLREIMDAGGTNYDFPELDAKVWEALKWRKKNG